MIVDRGDRTRRLSEGARIVLREGERAWCFHPGPYSLDLVPFAAAPEIGLRVGFAIDAPDPRAAQQRFDLFLASEACGEVALDAFAAPLQDALQRELAQGKLELPPCTTLDEWNAFRAGFNRLLYTRFGLTVDDCVPVDLADKRDFAAILAERAAQSGLGFAAVLARTMAQAGDLPETEAEPVGVESLPGPGAAAPAGAHDDAADDAAAMRRLFLELPAVMCALRASVLPCGSGLFRQHQALLNRLDLASLSVLTMPALDLAAPGQVLARAAQARRASQSRLAATALDEAWALLARLEDSDEARHAGLLDEAERIVANLEQALAMRRALCMEES